MSWTCCPATPTPFRRWRGRQIPSDRVVLITHSPATIRRFPRFIRTDAIFDLSLILGVDDFAMGNLGRPVCGDQREDHGEVGCRPGDRP